MEDMPDELDALYAARPEEFTALRTSLTVAAKKRGDAEAAKRIAAARKPTTAAWVVNALVHTDADARDRLRDLSAQLREAHAEMDGERIRALSAEQRQLVNQLTKAAFSAAELTNPSAALRDDVTATLQAAIADPDVADRLGTLVKAEQWSGFGFGVSTTKTPPPKKQAPTPPAPTKPTPAGQDQPRRRELEAARAEMAEARKAKADTDETLRDRHQELAAARTRHDEAQRKLRAAERDLTEAERAYAEAEQAGLDSSARISELRDRLEQLRG
ncbi:hypothetical protein BH10ACT9_BH10ACT9_26490 [soil metagenome]